MRRALSPSIAALGVAACAGVPADTTGQAETAPPVLGLFGTGYPTEGAPCRRSGETGFTNRFLDDAADLVACPPGTDAGRFAAATGATEVARLEGWILFTIPRR